MLLQRWFGVAAFAAGMCLSALGQQITTAKVVFRNPGPFAQADLEAVAGVHVGQRLSLKDMQRAAQNLADTGCFDDVHLDSSGSPNALTLIFVLKPAISGDLHPVVFENFVWLTPDELRTAVHSSAPLFAAGGKLPETGNVLDAVNAGLQAALASKGVPTADVGHDLALATSAQPVSLIKFHVNRPAVVLRTVTVTGGPAAMAYVQAGAGKLKGARYISGTALGSTDDVLLKPLFDAGYLDARLAGEKLTVGSAEGDTVPVDLAATVESGAPYTVGALTWPGTPVVSAEAFAASAKLHTGDPASRAKLWASEAAIDVAYHKLGYMDAYVDPGATENPATHTVDYKLNVVPGEVFHVHNTTVEGLPPEAKAQFDLAWNLKPGAPYDADYVRAFLMSNTALRSLSGYVGSFQAAADPSTHLVDVTVTFQPVASGHH